MRLQPAGIPGGARDGGHPKESRCTALATATRTQSQAESVSLQARFEKAKREVALYPHAKERRRKQLHNTGLRFERSVRVALAKFPAVDTKIA